MLNIYPIFLPLKGNVLRKFSDNVVSERINDGLEKYCSTKCSHKALQLDTELF